MNYKEKISYKAETYDFLMLLLLIHISIHLKNMDIELFSILEIIILHIIQCIIYIFRKNKQLVAIIIFNNVLCIMD